MALTRIISNTLAVNAVSDSALSSTGVSAGTYGNSTNIPTVTVDEDGRLTAASNTSIANLSITTLTTSGNATIGGNLTVNGTTTTVNTETINLADNIITLNSNATGSASENAGIEIERGDDTNVSLRWNETSDNWELTINGTNYYGILTSNSTLNPAKISPAITTLGTVTTGTWEATNIDILYGGTGASTAIAAINNLLPSQTSNTGKYLKTDGTNVSWATVPSSYTNTDVKTYLSGGTYDANIIPATDNIYSLGSTTKQWKDIYVGPGSLYVNGQKVLEESSGNIVVSCDINQNLVLSTSGSGDIELTPTGSGIIAVKGSLKITAGKNITSSDGNAIVFGNQIAVDSLTSKSSNTDLTLTGNGTGKVYLNDNAEVSGNLVVSGNLTISGTTTTINTETISLADNIIDLNSNFSSGTPTENSGIRILRGDESPVQFRWNESSDYWEMTENGADYYKVLNANSSIDGGSY